MATTITVPGANRTTVSDTFTGSANTALAHSIAKLVMFVSPYQVICRSLDSGNSERDSCRMTIARAVVRNLLLELVTRVPFDADDYLAKNPDVAAAIRRGEIASAHEHYSSNGYFEGREGAGPAFDEAWYLKHYPDVALAVKSGQWLSGWQHYRSEGMFEWRTPNRAAEADMDRWRDLLKVAPAMPEPALFD